MAYTSYFVLYELSFREKINICTYSFSADSWKLEFRKYLDERLMILKEELRILTLRAIQPPLVL